METSLRRYWCGRFDPEPRPVALLPVVVINGVEVDWNKAPEGATHVCVLLTGTFKGWRRVADGVVSKVHATGELEVMFRDIGLGYLKASKHTVFARPGLAQLNQAEPVKVAPKKQVGWWT